MKLIKRNEGRFPSEWNNFLNNDWFGFPNMVQTGTNLPAVNVKDTADSYLVEIAAPGKEKEDFKVDLDNNLLTITSEQKSESNGNDTEGNYTRREFNYQSFRRTFTLPDSAEAGKTTASYKDGVLCITIPKKEEAKPKPVKTIKIS